MLRDIVTTLLDALGLLLLAAGLAAAASLLIGWSALAIAGIVVLAGSYWSSRTAIEPKDADS